jgi:uridine kinase
VKQRPILVAIVGGSGAGKTWLSCKLQRALGLPSVRLSLDDFYLDQSHLAPSQRDQLNFDHPRAIDWRLAESALRACRTGRSVEVPRYSFITHRRLRTKRVVKPRAVILADGLWLLRKPQLRRIFDLCIFVACSTRLRLQRRLDRDLASRGRNGHSVRQQFRQTVAPMHKQFVAPQARWADIVLRHPFGEKEVLGIAARIWTAFHSAQRSETPPD